MWWNVRPRLMPMQVDEGGGALLNRLVTELGITVHTGVASTDDRRTTVTGSRCTLSDDDQLDAALLVFSAGVRPRDELARDCGLAIGRARRRDRPTSAAPPPIPHVFAIGEVAAVEGRCYGLVAPGYTMAEVVADRLLGGDRRIPGRRPVHQTQAARRRRRQFR